MFKKNRTIIVLAIFIVILGIVGWYFTQASQVISSTGTLAIKGKDTPVVSQTSLDTILNGYWTAFFALIFLGLSSIAAKIFTREIRHYNALINLDTQLNEMLGIIKDNVYQMRGFREHIVKGNIHWGNLRPVFIDRTHYENLFDVELINQVFVFFYQVRKVNDDMENLQAR